VEDLEATLEKLLTDAEDCALIAKRTTDGEKRDLFNRLATDLRSMASDIQGMITLKRVGQDGDIKKLGPSRGNQE